jgi:hypothetical protein
MVCTCHRHKSLQSPYVVKIPRGKVRQLLVRLYAEGCRGSAMFFKVGGYEIILLSVLEEVLLPAAHPEKD